MLKPLALLAMLFTDPAFASGTGINNGGDILLSYLESMRAAMLTTLHDLPPHRERLVCAAVDLTPAQRSLCLEVFTAFAPEVLALNASPVPFSPQDAPLEVTGPDGRPERVAALTELGPGGGIKFHVGTIAAYSPKQMLFLISHEMGHKVSFRGNYVTDNDPIGPFPRGRRLIDAFAESVVALAEDAGRVGELFQVLDSFACTTSLNGEDISFSSGASSRRFARRGEFSMFRTSMGELPFDFRVGVPEAGSTRLYLQADFRETAGCVGSDPSARSSTLKIVRVDERPENPLPPQILEKIELPGGNPLCQAGEAFGIAHGGLRFSCVYVGSFTQTPVSVRKR